MMAEWILPFKGRNESLAATQNFLWRHENIYLMDNHLAAAWCWSQHTCTQVTHSVLHIDAHYDPAGVNESALCDVSALQELTFDEYKSLSFQDGGRNVSTFRWDNYISNYHHLYSGLANNWYFSTHEIGAKPCFSAKYIPPSEIRKFINEANRAGNWVLNLDLDFFRSQDGVRYPPQDRIPLIEAIKELHDSSNDSVVTVALSPDCCGSWESAEELCDEFCGVFGISFSLPSD